MRAVVPRHQMCMLLVRFRAAVIGGIGEPCPSHYL
jgi:hypothetical protein